MPATPIRTTVDVTVAREAAGRGPVMAGSSGNLYVGPTLTASLAGLLGSLVEAGAEARPTRA